MQRTGKITDKLINHFGGNKSAAYVAAGLFAMGMLLFIINSVILLVSPERAFRTLRIFLKGGTDLFWIAAAMLGTKYYPTKRNKILMRTLIVSTTMVLSLSNRFFWLAEIVFLVSDITGLLRVSLSNNKYTYFITTTIYFVAFLMLCISVYSTNRKEVVTWYDLFSMLNDSKSMKVSFWVCGRWALGLIRGDKHYSYDRIDLAYDVDRVDEFLAWIKHARYEGKHRYSGGVRSYYSERYGELRIFPCLFEPDGSAVLTMENGDQLLLDEGFFKDVRVLGKTIPCIAPGGTELIRDVLCERAETEGLHKNGK